MALKIIRHIIPCFLWLCFIASCSNGPKSPLTMESDGKVNWADQGLIFINDRGQPNPSDRKSVPFSDRSVSLTKDNGAIINECISPAVKSIIDTIWKNRKQFFIDTMKSRLAKKDTYILYDIQTYTNNLLKYAGYCGDYDLLNGLSEIYLVAYDYLVTDSDGAKKWIYDTTTYSSLQGTEIILNNAQFLYAVSDALNIIAAIAETQRTSKMKELATKFAPIIVKDHLERWIFNEKAFSVAGWGCEDKTSYNHSIFLDKKLKRLLGTNKSYCNSVRDVDLWIIVATVNLLSATQRDSSLVVLNSSQKQKLTEYALLGTKLMENRLTQTALTDLNGKALTGLNFDRGAWDDHPDYAYTGYTGATFPQLADKKSGKDIGWDISHARRWIHAFQTLYQNKNAIGSKFPDESVMRGLSNQFAYKVFNKNFNQPLFTNFMDGSNGWYRIDYSSTTGFGYPPSGMSNSFMSGGYAFFSRYNQNLGQIAVALWNMLNAVWDNTNQELIEFAAQNYTSEVYNNYTRDTDLNSLRKKYNKIDSLELLMFLPSLVNP